MFTFTVTWMDGQVETFRDVPSFEMGDSWLHLYYDLETYSNPLVTIRTVKVEKP